MRAVVSARFTFVLAAFGVPLAVAADVEPAPEVPSALEANSTLEEVVVTAQKRAQNLQEVGVAVNAYGEATIRELKIENTADVARFTPNMNTRNTMGDTMPVITLRGVGSAT